MNKITETVQSLQSKKITISGVEECAAEVMKIRKSLDEQRDYKISEVLEAKHKYENVISNIMEQINKYKN